MGDLILTIPNNTFGNAAIEHLSGPTAFSDLGCEYRDSLSDRFPELESPRLLSQLPHTFHRVWVKDGDERAAGNRILRWHNGESPNRGKVDAAEKNEELMLAAPYLGLPFTIGGKHQDYLKLMRVDEAHQASVKGSKVRVAIVDSGLDRGAGIIAVDFYDLQLANPVHATLASMIDNDGHGTAMAKLVKAVAPAAEIYIVRVLDQGSVTLWNVLAGAGVAAFDCKATVVSMSLGFDSFLRCGVCGATGSARSVALEKLLEGITQSTSSRNCVYVAATGNESSSTSFNSPAAYASAVAVGSVNSVRDRSSFSNYGTTHKRHLMAPGGEKNSANAVTEHVGSGSVADCCGTSVATAYAAGMLALLWSDARYAGFDRARFLSNVLSNHCVHPPNWNQLEYGEGVIEYRPPAETNDTDDAIDEDNIASDGDIQVYADRVVIKGITLRRRAT